jgi:hypothetical protein
MASWLSFVEILTVGFTPLLYTLLHMLLLHILSNSWDSNNGVYDLISNYSNSPNLYHHQQVRPSYSTIMNMKHKIYNITWQHPTHCSQLWKVNNIH